MDTETPLNSKHLSLAILLAVILTLSGLFLMFTSLFTINDFLEGYIEDPWYLPHSDYSQNQQTYDTIVAALKPIGYISFIIILMLILIGVIIKHYNISLLGSYALYIPLFGQFSFAMTALFAGIGIMRIIWVPIFDIEPELLNSAAIILFPWFIYSVVGELRIELLYGVGGLFLLSMFLLVLLGVFIFAFGVVTWFYGKFQKRKIINFWIYRYSRHPQYLGLILLNYGLLIFPILLPQIRVSLPTLPWLIVTLIIIGLAITEENKLLRENNEEITTWRNKAPFMIPLPKVITSLILIPTKIVLKKDWPENNKEIVSILLIYGLILVIFSLPLMVGMKGEMEYLYYLITKL